MLVHEGGSAERFSSIDLLWSPFPTENAEWVAVCVKGCQDIALVYHAARAKC